MKTLFAAFVVLALSAFMHTPVVAADACRFTLDDTLPQLARDGTPYVVITDPAKIAEFVASLPEPPAGAVSAILIAKIDAGVAYGLVIDGCLLPPVLVPGTAPTSERRSGLQPDGSVYA